jgi:cell wall-associated NlpC family hydrolase
LRTHTQRTKVNKRVRLALGLTALSLLALPVGPTWAGSGGIGAGGGTEPAPTGGKAKLVDGKAIAPAGAPAEVVAAIRAANRIRRKPYIYGGGHQRFRSKGYDCSGAVSYALHKAGLLDTPMDSSDLMKWGARGKGSWITVYSNPSHAYAVIAGLRWDTSMTAGDGPGWSTQKRPATGYRKRHWKGL